MMRGTGEGHRPDRDRRPTGLPIALWGLVGLAGCGLDAEGDTRPLQPANPGGTDQGATGDDDPPVRCRPGDSSLAADGCNTCTCSDAGTWACTDMACAACAAGDPPPVVDRCTACTCEDGRWACIPTPCPPPPCEPGQTRPDDDGCNTCTCLGDGTWACTRMACPAPCTPGDERPSDDGCNVCTCLDDGSWACTEIACPECRDDADCVIGGCSGEVCARERLGSACIWLPEFQCYQQANCGCIQGSCAWGPPDQVQACLDRF
jgi:eight-cysteine-cluster-containing protein